MLFSNHGCVSEDTCNKNDALILANSPNILAVIFVQGTVYTVYNIPARSSYIKTNEMR